MQPCTISLAAAAWRLISKMEAVAFFLLSFGRVLKVISRIVLEGCKMYKTKLCTSFWSEPKFKFNDYRSILDFQLGPDLNDVQFFCVIHFKIGTVMWYFHFPFKAQLNFVWRGRADFFTQCTEVSLKVFYPVKNR